MQIRINRQEYSIDQLRAAAGTNNFPDILFFASGKVATPGEKAKFRITLLDNGSRLKRWSDEVEYTGIDGQAFGNMLEGYLLKKDEVSGSFEIVFEIKVPGSGYQPLPPVDLQPVAAGPIQGMVAVFDNGAGVSGTVGLLIMA